MQVISQVNIRSSTLDQNSLAEMASLLAIRYRVVERFLCEVERWLLKPAEETFDVSPIRDGIKTLRSPLATKTDIDAATERLTEEFTRWEQLIADKDSRIETYNFRRFCDSAADPLDNDIYIALANFYKDRPFSQSIQSKFDLVATRLYTDVDETGRRFLRFGPQEIETHVEQTFGGRQSSGEKFLDTEGAAAAINSFITEAQALDDFESLIECRLFDRFREFKQELGEQFFEPQVVAATIQCNVVFANAFNEMLESANESLSDILRSDLDIPAALVDTAPDAQAHLSDLLKEFFDFKPDESFLREGKVSEHLLELLSLAGEKSDSHADPLIEAPTVEFDSSLTARERLMPVIEALAQPMPDDRVIVAQLNQTRALQHLNLSDFLYSEGHVPDSRGRRILGLILWTEEFRRNELEMGTSLTAASQHEVLSLIQRSEEFAAVLKADVNAASDSTKGRLLIIQNALLESRLRLEGAIVKFTSRNLSPMRSVERQTQTEAPKPETRSSVPRPLVAAQPAGPSASWVAWLFLVLAVGAAAFYFYPRNQFDVPNDPTITEHIDTSKLADHDLIINGYGRDNTMFVTVKDNWTQLSEEKQKESMQELLNYQGGIKYENVVVRNAAGKVVGNISALGLPTSNTDSGN